MQNVESLKSVHTDEDTLYLVRDPPTSLCSIPDSTTDTQLQLTDASSTQAVQSDPETRPKPKTRSRLSSAFRRLSKSTRKKENPLLTAKQLPPTAAAAPAAPAETILPESVISSGGEEAAGELSLSTSVESNKPQKKRSKLTKRFLLGSLKKSSPKISQQKSTDEADNITLALETKHFDTAPPTQTQSLEITESTEGNRKDKTRSVDISSGSGTSQQRLDRIRKVQITISGKRLETRKSLPVTSTEITGALPSETDYLIPNTEELPKAATTATAAKVDTTTKLLREPSPSSPGSSPTTKGNGGGLTPDTAKATKKKKLKSKKVSSSGNNNAPGTTTTKSSTQTAAAAEAAAQTTTTATPPTTPTEERYVITQSTRDTPPLERAPAKPSRVVVAIASYASNQTSTSSGAVRKPTTTRAAAKSTATIGQSSSESSVSGLGTTTTSVIKRQRSASGATPTEHFETELMQNTQSTLQRGHRFPKPAAAAISVGSKTPSLSISSPAIKEETTTSNLPVAAPQKQQQRQQRQLQFQLQSQSHASQSKSLPPTPPDEEEDDHNKEEQQLQTLQSNAQQQLLLIPPAYPPPPIPIGSPSITPETRSPAHRRHPSTNIIETLPLSLRTESATLPQLAEESVGTTSSSGADEVVSSAESVRHSEEYSGNNIQNPHVAGHSLSLESSSQGTPTLTEQLEAEVSAVRFAVGSAVRPQSTSGATSFDTLRDQNSIESLKSSDSQSPVSESSRRRIRYVPQPTLFDDFETSLERRREAWRYQATAGLSEYSIDSDEFENNELTNPTAAAAAAGGDNQQMPAFGDLTMDQDMEPTIMTSSNSEKREHLYKILVIGELGTGKTSFIKRYVHQFFSQNYRATIGVDFALKVLHWDANTIVRLQLWDIAGQERFGNMTRVYYKEAVGAFIVFDVTRSGTFDCVSKWKEDLDSKVQLPDGSPIPCILLANKCDQEKQGIVTTPEKMDEYVRENGFAGWFETSAKENMNIDEAARALVNKILLNDKLISAGDLADSEKFNLNNSEGDQNVTDTKSKCAC